MRNRPNTNIAITSRGVTLPVAPPLAVLWGTYAGVVKVAENDIRTALPPSWKALPSGS